MVQTLSMKCPHCSQVSDVYLSTNASVIILSCPHCTTPMMYFESKIFPLSDKQIHDIQSTSQDWAVMRILQNIVHDTNPLPTSFKAQSTAVKQATAPLPEVIPSTVGGKYITEDDITNLRIELETCNDSQQFIDNMS